MQRWEIITILLNKNNDRGRFYNLKSFFEILCAFCVRAVHVYFTAVLHYQQ